jgi:hypothetical protein
MDNREHLLSANRAQSDTDGDGYGNACDCDIDGEQGGDGTVGCADYTAAKAAYGAEGGDNADEKWDADADFDGDMVVGYKDYLIFRARHGTATPFE